MLNNSAHLKNFDVWDSTVSSAMHEERRIRAGQKYILRDPRTDGVVISGPIAGAMQRSAQQSDGRVVIQIEVAESDLKIKYE